jgi:hypothetical protein
MQLIAAIVNLAKINPNLIMRNFSMSGFALGKKNTVLISLWLLMTVPGAVMADESIYWPSKVEIFTDLKHPVSLGKTKRALKQAKIPIVYFNLDQSQQLQQALNDEIPEMYQIADGKKGQTGKYIQNWLSKNQTKWKDKFKYAYQGITTAVLDYKLSKYPAIVFDGKIVTYTDELYIGLNKYVAYKKRKYKQAGVR